MFNIVIWVRSRLRDAACEAGNVAIVFALAMPVVVGGAAFSVETGYHYLKHVRLQAAADAAAYAGAVELSRGGDIGAVRAAATTAAGENSWRAAAGTITVNTPPTSGPNAGGTAVEVVLRQDEPRFFSAMLTDSAVVLQSRAVGSYRPSSDACILALNKTAARAIDITGNARMQLTGCDVVTNSVAENALSVWGSARVNAACVMSAGGVTNKDGLTLEDCASAITQAPPVPDPFRSLPEPTQPGGCKSDNAKVLSPGAYCGGMTLKGDVELQPGVYYMGGDFRVNANANVTGSGVTIYMSGGARVHMNGNATVNLSAPTTGTYAGMLFLGDRNNSSAGENVFNGTAASHLTGNLYFPTQALAYLGNFSGDGGCTHIVADTITWSGNTAFNTDCKGRGLERIPGRQSVSLVE